MQPETVNLMLRITNSTAFGPVPTTGYKVGKVLFVHQTGKNDWGISSINGYNVPTNTRFKTRKRALEVAKYLSPYAEASLDENGDITDDTAKRQDFLNAIYKVRRGEI